jgi:hypothetical protein
MHSTLVWFFGGFFFLALIVLLREAYCFLRWRQSLGRLDEHEWTRRLASIRDHDQ